VVAAFSVHAGSLNVIQVLRLRCFCARRDHESALSATRPRNLRSIPYLPVFPDLHETVRKRDQTDQADNVNKSCFVFLLLTKRCAVAFRKDAKLVLGIAHESLLSLYKVLGRAP
jgi:hypothetical protein